MSASENPDWQRHLEAALAACRRAGEIHRRHFRADGLAVELKADASPVTRSDRLAEEALRESLHRATPGLGLLGEEYGQEGDERDRWILDPLDGTRNFVAGLPWFAILVGLQLDGEIVLGVVHAPALGAGSGLGAAAADTLGETWWAARGQGAFAGTGTDPAACRARRLQVSRVDRLADAFVVHGGLVHIQRQGLWSAFSGLVARAGRTRGFGDWWGHMLVAEGRCDAMIEGVVALHDLAAVKPILEEAGGGLHTRSPLGTGFLDAAFSCNRPLASEIGSLLGISTA